MGAAVNLAALFVAHELLGCWVYAALVISFTVAVSFNFVLIKRWTFRDTCWSPRWVVKQYARFYSIATTGLGLNLIVFGFMHDVAGAGVYSSQALAITMVAPFHFFLNKVLTFPADVPGDGDEPAPNPV